MTRTIEYGQEYWKLHPNGAIERPGLVAPDPITWRIIGATTYNNFGNQVAFHTFYNIFRAPNEIPWYFKNGKQRTFIRDLDHGTIREWRSPKHQVLP